MFVKWKLIYLIITIGIGRVVSFIDPLTLLAGAGAGLGALNYEFVKDQTYCRYVECCNERWVPGNMTELRRKLQNDLFGQHIVLEHLLPALEAHLTQEKSRKPLVISFHGTPGTGKNYVVDMIADALYAKGVGSKYFHKYHGRADFPLAANADEYKARINSDVRDAIKDCPRSLFIFDEVDKMPPGVFDSLTSLVDYNLKMDGNDNTQAIFIFLSNTAGAHISDRLASLLKEGMSREKTKLSNFEEILRMAAYNMDGGMKKTSMIETYAIDHYLPFLPMEKKHLQLCVESEFRRWGRLPTESEIASIIKDSVVYDRTHGLFSMSGCKAIEKKVAVYVQVNK